MSTINCFCCFKDSSPLNGSVYDAPPPITSTKPGPQVQRMEQVADDYFQKADERAKLLDTPSPQKGAASSNVVAEAPHYLPPSQPVPPPDKPVLANRVVARLTVEDIATNRHLSDPDLLAQYQQFTRA